MKLFRITLTGEEPPHYTISNAFQKNFEVTTLYWDEIENISYLNDVIQARVKAHKYDCVFMQIQGPGIISIKTAQVLAENVPVVFNWTGDVREDITWYKELSPYVVTLFTNMTDVKKIREFGQRSDYLQTGYDHLYYFNQNRPRINNIAFCGNHYGNMFPLSDERVQIARLLKMKYPENFNLYGRNWDQVGLKAEGIANNEREALLYNATSLAISISHFNYSRYFSDRLLRELACGCCVLSHKFEDCELEFKDNEHIVYWETQEELLDKIDFYKKNSDKAREIGNKAAKYVSENYSWDCFINNLKKMIEIWRYTYQK